MTPSTNNSKTTWYLELLKTQGISTFLLLALAFCIWRTMDWTGQNVILPLVNRQMVFMNTLAESDNTRNRLATEIKDNTDATNRLIVESQRMLLQVSATQTELLQIIKIESEKTRAAIQEKP